MLALRDQNATPAFVDLDVDDRPADYDDQKLQGTEDVNDFVWLRRDDFLMEHFGASQLDHLGH